MSGIDWSKAPEGATHFSMQMKFWVKQDEHAMWLAWKPFGRISEKAMIGWCFCGEPKDLISRDWNGEGMPPVGTVCEFAGFNPEETLPTDPRAGDQVTVIAHFKSGSIDVAAFTFYAAPEFEYLQVAQGAYGCFRPIRTAEQIAADERAALIKQACADIETAVAPYNQTIDCSAAIRATVEAMLAAGYRKQVQP